jgi:MFS family permease
MPEQRRHWYGVGLIWLAALTTSTLVPLYLLSAQPKEFGHFELGPFIAFSAVVAVALGTLGTLVYAVLAAWMPHIWARLFALFVLLWTVVTGFVFPVVHGEGMVGPQSLSIDYTNLLLALLLTTAFVRVTVSKQFATLPFLFFAFVMSFTLLPGARQVYQLSTRSEAAAKTRAEFLSLSREENVIVLSFDGLPGNIVREVFGQWPELRDAFKDFVFFDEAISLAPATTASITAELFGNRNYAEVGDTQAEVIERLDASALPLNRASKAGTAAFTFGIYYNEFNLDPAKRLDTGDIYGGRPQDVLLNSTTFLEYAVARMATRHAVRLLRQGRLIRQAIAALTAGRSGELSERLVDHRGPPWDINYIKTHLDLEAFIANVKVGRSERYLAFMHFLHTHFPVDFDRTCEYHSDDVTWYLQNQSEAGIKDEVICALTQAARFVDRLRALGIYEKSFLVIKSDHGQPPSYFDAPPHNYRVNKHPLWGVNRYLPLLMIKDRGRVAPSMEVISETVTLGDLSKTLCRELLGGGSVCEPFPGVDLSAEHDLRENPVIYVNVVKDAESTWEFDTHRTVELNRAIAGDTFVDLLKQAREVEVSSASEAD